MGVATPLAINLAAIGEAAAFDNTDYKALVCIFLYGGNDYANTVVPYDPANYALYHQIRAGAAGEDAGGYRAGARRACADRADAQRRAGAHRQSAVRAGAAARRAQGAVGPGPARGAAQRGAADPADRRWRSTRAPIACANPLPPKLFSHNDQQSIWQSNGSEGSTIGWGGRLGDIALSSNATNSLLTCISASGNAVFVAGRDALQYQISPDGAISDPRHRPDADRLAPRCARR